MLVTGAGVKAVVAHRLGQHGGFGRQHAAVHRHQLGQCAVGRGKHRAAEVQAFDHGQAKGLVPAHRKDQPARGIEQAGLLRAAHHAVKVDLARQRPAKAALEVDAVSAQHVQLHASHLGHLDRAAHVLHAPGRLAQKVVVGPWAVKVHRAIAAPIESVVDKLGGTVTRGVVTREEHGVQRQRLGLARVAVLGDQIGPAQLGAGVELEMRNVHIGRDLALPRCVGADGQHMAEVAAGPVGHQIAHAVTELHQRLAQIPDHTLGTAVAVDGNGGVVDEQDVHREIFRLSFPWRYATPADHETGAAQASATSGTGFARPRVAPPSRAAREGEGAKRLRGCFI